MEASFSALVQWLPRQVEACRAAASHQFVLYGGSRGPGKSYWLRWYLLRLVLQLQAETGRPVRVGLFCEDYPALKDRQVSKIRLEFPRWLGQVRESTTDGFGFHLKGGSCLSLRNLDDPSKYQSAEFAAIGVDELTKNTVDTFDILRGSLRWPGVERPRFLAATNPGGIGHEWVKRYWVDRLLPEELRPLASEFVFVRALPEDNPHLAKSYWQMLDTLPPDLARAWRHGEWDVFAGQVFSQWRTDKHICRPFAIPPGWRKWRAVDWGFRAPFCCLWLALEPDSGRVYVYRELYAKGLTDREQARRIVEATGKDEMVHVTFADPAMWARKASEDRIFSSADEYRAVGVVLVQADNDRLSGKRAVDRALGSLADGRAGVQVFENCQNLIRTLPALPYDEHLQEDVDSGAEDHAYDALRYGLTRHTGRPGPQLGAVRRPGLRGSADL